MRLRRSAAAVVAATILSLPAYSQNLISIIRSGDNAATAAAIDAASDVNAPDANGVTPLMHAVMYADLAVIRKLIAKGADVNAAAKSGRTALLTATARPAKAQLLVDSGANIDAKAKDGTTPLRAAARANETVAHMLLAKGAKPDGLVLRAAADSGRIELIRTLLKNPAAFTAEEKSAALNSASQSGHAAIMHLLLAAGAGPSGFSNAKGPRITSLMMAAHMGDAALVKALLAKGADVNQKGWDNYTPLHMAAASERPSAAVVRLLLAAGADPNALDSATRTPAELAARNGRTVASRELNAKPARFEPVAAQPRDSFRQSVQHAIRALQPAGPVFFEKNRCMSCHHQSITQMAIKRVRGAGIAIDPDIEAVQRTTFAKTLAPFREPILNNGVEIPGFLAITSYGLVGIHDDGQAPNEDTDTIAHALSSRQEADGSFNIYDVRPPLGSSRMKWTALSMRALQLYGPRGAADDYNPIVDRARLYLEANDAPDTQSLAYRILGLRWAGSDPELIEKLAKKLAAAQRNGGGWAQRAEMAPDAFATGQALWALNEGAGWNPNSAIYRKGADFLRRTQSPDGSWHVRTRALGFQPLHDTGFPHGRDQWISSAATGYAVIGLAPLIEDQVRRSSR